MTIDYKNFSVLTIIPVYNEIGKIGKVISKFSSKFVDEIFLILDSPSNIIKKEINHSAEKIDVPINIIEKSIF